MIAVFMFLSVFANESCVTLDIAPWMWLIFRRVEKYDVCVCVHVSCSVACKHKLQNNLHSPILQSPSEILTYVYTGIVSHNNTGVYYT